MVRRRGADASSAPPSIRAAWRGAGSRHLGANPFGSKAVSLVVVALVALKCIVIAAPPEALTRLFNSNVVARGAALLVIPDRIPAWQVASGVGALLTIVVARATTSLVGRAERNPVTHGRRLAPRWTRSTCSALAVVGGVLAMYSVAANCAVLWGHRDRLVAVLANVNAIRVGPFWP